MATAWQRSMGDVPFFFGTPLKMTEIQTHKPNFLPRAMCHIFLAPLKNLSKDSNLSIPPVWKPIILWGGDKKMECPQCLYICYGTLHPDSRRFLSLEQFFPTWERVCIDQVRSVVSMCSMLLRYSLEPGLVAVHLLQRAWLWPLVYQETDAHSWINQFDDRKQDATSKPWHHLDRVFFPLTQEDKKKICLQGREH